MSSSANYESNDWNIHFGYDSIHKKFPFTLSSKKLDITYTFWFTKEQAMGILKEINKGIEK